MIAKTETNRAFSMSQCQADRQFLDQNGLDRRGVRKWGSLAGPGSPSCVSWRSTPGIKLMPLGLAAEAECP